MTRRFATPKRNRRAEKKQALPRTVLLGGRLKICAFGRPAKKTAGGAEPEAERRAKQTPPEAERKRRLPPQQNIYGRYNRDSERVVRNSPIKKRVHENTNRHLGRLRARQRSRGLGGGGGAAPPNSKTNKDTYDESARFKKTML